MFTCLVSFYFYFYFWTSLLMCEAPLIVSLNRHWLSSSGKSDEFSQTNNEKPTAAHWLINLNHTTLLWSYFYLYNKQMWHYFYLSWLLHVKFYFHKFGRSTRKLSGEEPNIPCVGIYSHIMWYAHTKFSLTNDFDLSFG